VNPNPTEVSTSYGLKLSTPSLNAGDLLSPGGQATIRAYVFKTTTYENGAEVSTPVEDGTIINFFIISIYGVAEGDAITDSGTIKPIKTTVNGYADAVYQAESYGGEVKIYATTDPSETNSANDVILFEVANIEALPTAILIDSVTPETIGVAGSGTQNISIITFTVTDNLGNPVPDGTVVTLNISTPLGGGEELSAAQTETTNGKAWVSLISGTVSGTVGINASYNDVNTNISITTEAKVTIVSGLPAAEQFGMAVEFFNIAGGKTFGLQDTIEAYLGDRYGNVVPDGTSVSFMSEGGTVGTSDGFDPSTVFGVAQAILQTSPPTTPGLGGVIGSALGNPGLCKVVAYTPGDEGFSDINGNNVYDEGIDILTVDMSEPYIDANDNGQYDSGEKYIDSDGNGSFTEADGQYQSNTIIWDSMNVLFSADQAALNLSPASFVFDGINGGTYLFTYYLGDVYDNALVGGTSISVTKSGSFTGGELAGATNYTTPDSPGLGQTYSFSLIIPAADDPADPPTGTITITVEATPNTGSAGANSGGNIVSYSYGNQ